MELIAEIDEFIPDEDLVEVLIGEFNAWGATELQTLYPALEAILEGAEAVTTAAAERLNVLHDLQAAIHEGEAAEVPYSVLAKKYVDAVKYHLVVDVKEMIPLASQLPEHLSVELAQQMSDLKMELE